MGLVINDMPPAIDQRPISFLGWGIGLAIGLCLWILLFALIF